MPLGWDVTGTLLQLGSAGRGREIMEREMEVEDVNLPFVVRLSRLLVLVLLICGWMDHQKEWNW